MFKIFINKNIRDYHDLYVQSDTFLLADVFENFRNKCIEILELDPVRFLSAPRLAWRACLEKAEITSELLADIDILLMVEKGIRGGTCHAIHRYAEANNKCMKNYDKNKESSYTRNETSTHHERNSAYITFHCRRNEMNFIWGGGPRKTAH